MVLKRPAPPATRPSKSPRSCATGWPKEIGPIAKPRTSAFGDNLPKTRSGKIMRRLLHRSGLATRGKPEISPSKQDTSTLEVWESAAM